MSRWMLITLLWIPCGAALGSGGYVCTTEQSVGFQERDGKWSNTRFVERDAYAVVPSSREGFGWEARSVGVNSQAVAWSKGGFDEEGNINLYDDRAHKHVVRMNRERMRFVAMYTDGYWDGSRRTPNVDIGNCAKQ